MLIQPAPALFLSLLVLTSIPPAAFGWGSLSPYLDSLALKPLDVGTCRDSLKGRFPPPRIVEACSAKRVPRDLYSNYSLNGAVEVRTHKRDPRRKGRRRGSSRFKCDTGKMHLPYTKKLMDVSMGFVKQKKSCYYHRLDQDLYMLFTKFPQLIQGKSVAIMGSQVPWYETIAHHYNASNVTTIEYQKIKKVAEWLEVVEVEEYRKQGRFFDVALSLSSFEHDGLGRYGDPLSPDGDLRAMDEMKCTVAVGGILLLAVPTGKDILEWNMNRIYGPVRLPLLIRRWKLIAICATGFGGYYGISNNNYNHPILVLANLGGTDADFTDHNLKVIEERFASSRTEANPRLDGLKLTGPFWLDKKLFT